jgi:hypothetical protein
LFLKHKICQLYKCNRKYAKEENPGEKRRRQRENTQYDEREKEKNKSINEKVRKSKNK